MEDVVAIHLKNSFQEFGKVVDVYISGKKGTRSNRKFGFIRFANEKQAEEAIRRTQNQVWVLIASTWVGQNLIKEGQQEARWQILT